MSNFVQFVDVDLFDEKIKDESFYDNPGFLGYSLNIIFLAEKLPYCQFFGTKVNFNTNCLYQNFDFPPFFGLPKIGFSLVIAIDRYNFSPVPIFLIYLKSNTPMNLIILGFIKILLK